MVAHSLQLQNSIRTVRPVYVVWRANVDCELWCCGGLESRTSSCMSCWLLLRLCSVRTTAAAALAIATVRLQPALSTAPPPKPPLYQYHNSLPSTFILLQPSIVFSMGKKLAAKISHETHLLAEQAVQPDGDSDDHRASAIASASDAPLFFVDKAGNVESRRNKKRRERDEQEAAEEKQAQAEVDATLARNKRRASDRAMRKKAKASTDTTAASTATSHSSTTTAASHTPSTSTPSVVADPLYDLWSDAAAVAAAPEPAPLLRPRTHHKLATQFTTHLNRSIVPAAKATVNSLPHPGQSFHPAADDHAVLVNRATAQYMHQLQQSERIKRYLNPDDYPEVLTPPASSSTTIVPPTSATDEMEEGSEDVKGVMRPPTLSRPLTQTQRNKREQHKLKQRSSSEQSQQSRLHKQIDRIPLILQNVQKQQALADKRRAIIQRLKQHTPDRMPRLGPYKQEEGRRVEEVRLDDEMTGRLRDVRVSVHLMGDAMRRLQERGLVEVRKRVAGQMRRYKLKEYERYKDWKEEGVLPQYVRKE